MILCLFFCFVFFCVFKTKLSTGNDRAEHGMLLEMPKISLK